MTGSLAPLSGLSMAEDGAARNEGLHHRALEPCALERGVVRARDDVLFGDDPRKVGIDEDEIGRCARDSRPDGRPRISAGRCVMARSTVIRSMSPEWTSRNAAASSVSRPIGAVRCFGEGLALDLGVLRVMGGMDDVDGARFEPLDHRLPVVLGPQRRGELEERAVGRDVVLVERQIVDRDAARKGRLERRLPSAIRATDPAVEICAAW